MVPIVRTSSPFEAIVPSLPLSDLGVADIRQAQDGLHAVLRIHGTEHRLWLKEPPQLGAPYAFELPLDDDFDIRAHASRRLWRAINGRAPGPAFHQLSAQRRERLVLALRALDGHINGGTYRAIAEVLFGAERIPERAWKTHDLRSRTIRLIQDGLALMLGSYRSLLRYGRKRK